MVLELPAGLTYGQIQWTVVELNALTSNDLDNLPDIAGLSGLCTIKASPTPPLLVQGGTEHMSVFLGPWTFPIVNGILQDAKGNTDINLPATDCVIFNPTNWTYAVSFTLSDGKTRGTFSFSLPTGSVVDFTDIAPVPDSNGTVLVRGPQGPKGDTGAVGPSGGVDDGSVSALINNTSTQTSGAVGVVALSSVQNADGVQPLGNWNFSRTPSVNGVLLGTGGSGGSVSDASFSTKGIVKLAGDLAGTADVPAVPGLATKSDLGHQHVSSDLSDATSIGLQVLTATDAAAVRTAIGAGVPAVDATTSIKGLVRLAGDLAGTATAPTVPGLANKAALSHTHVITDLAVTGTHDNTTFLRGDGVWAVPPGTGGSGSVISIAQLPAGATITMVQNSDGTWPNRRSSRTDLVGVWLRIVAGSADPASATSPAVAGAYQFDYTLGA